MKSKVLLKWLWLVPVASMALPLVAVACGEGTASATNTTPSVVAHSETEYQAVKPTGALKLRFGVKMKNWTFPGEVRPVSNSTNQVVGSTYRSGNWSEWLIPYYDTVPEWLNQGKIFHPTTETEISKLFKSQYVEQTVDGEGYQGRDYISGAPVTSLFFELPPFFPTRDVKAFYPSYDRGNTPRRSRLLDMRYLYGDFEWPGDSEPYLVPGTLTITDLGNSFNVTNYNKGEISFTRSVGGYNTGQFAYWGERLVDVSTFGRVGT